MADKSDAQEKDENYRLGKALHLPPLQSRNAQRKEPREIYFRHRERGRREKNFSAKKKAGESSEETTVIEVATQKNAPKQKRSGRCFILYQNTWHSRRVATN
ncbi:MAG: hypothetical protein IPJ67_03185 [Candidatus Moraniibacteriota bacterium]|nr:MAG: hypothetical protein IPJ67_03185 [Candidatus Moranbacteria bacterium]